MKYLAILAAIALVGCQQAVPPTKPEVHPEPMTKYDYIAKNRCEVVNVTGGFQYYDEGVTKTANITITYLCPNGVYVAVDGGN